MDKITNMISCISSKRTSTENLQSQPNTNTDDPTDTIQTPSTLVQRCPIPIKFSPYQINTYKGLKLEEMKLRLENCKMPNIDPRLTIPSLNHPMQSIRPKDKKIVQTFQYLVIPLILQLNDYLESKTTNWEDFQHISTVVIRECIEEIKEIENNFTYDTDTKSNTEEANKLIKRDIKEIYKTLNNLDGIYSRNHTKLTIDPKIKECLSMNQREMRTFQRKFDLSSHHDLNHTSIVTPQILQQAVDDLSIDKRTPNTERFIEKVCQRMDQKMAELREAITLLESVVQRFTATARQANSESLAQYISKIEEKSQRSVNNVDPERKKIMDGFRENPLFHFFVFNYICNLLNTNKCKEAFASNLF